MKKMSMEPRFTVTHLVFLWNPADTQTNITENIKNQNHRFQVKSVSFYFHFYYWECFVPPPPVLSWTQRHDEPWVSKLCSWPRLCSTPQLARWSSWSILRRTFTSWRWTHDCRSVQGCLCVWRRVAAQFIQVCCHRSKQLNSMWNRHYRPQHEEDSC